MRAPVVVTGAAGFIGSHVVGRLLAEGRTVRGIDNFDPAYPRAIKERAVAPYAGQARFQLREGDLGEGAALDEVLAGAGVIVHAAARAGVRESVGAPARTARANVAPTAALLQAAGRAGVERLVLLSSSSVYGRAATPFRETDAWLRPTSPYAASKRAAELLAAGAARRGVRVAVLRLFSVYGPGQRPDQAAWRFAVRLAAGEAVDQYGDGSAARDFTYVGDVADAVARAVAWVERPGADLLTVNVGAGAPVRVDRFRALLAERLGVPDRARALAAAPGDVPRTVAATDRARTVLDWTARTTLAEGLAAFAEWFEVTHG